MTIAAIANLLVAYFMRREATRSGSIALKAEATHLLTNVVQAGAIIAGLLLVLVTGEPVFDALVALMLAAYMVWAAIGLVRSALTEVMDEALPDNELQTIRGVLEAHRHEVRGYHRLRTRRSGATRHVDMHLTFAPGRTIEDVHHVADRISDEIHAHLPGTVVVIHTEPHHPEDQSTEPGPDWN
jgi:cation diffusion facilitator family transporter